MTHRPSLDWKVYEKYMDLDLSATGKIQAEYVWIGGSGQDVRSKGMTIELKGGKLPSLPELRIWNFDGA